MTEFIFFGIIYVPSCLSNFPVGWLSGQKQRSVKPSGYALHRFESYPYQNLTPRKRGFFVGKQGNCLPCVGFERRSNVFV